MTWHALTSGHALRTPPLAAAGSDFDKQLAGVLGAPGAAAAGGGFAAVVSKINAELALERDDAVAAKAGLQVRGMAAHSLSMPPAA